MELLAIRTTNDTNGNARVAWVVINNGAVYDGELQGPEGKPERFRDDRIELPITVAPKEFKMFANAIKWAKAHHDRQATAHLTKA
jgi:hypothetical protein